MMGDGAGQSGHHIAVVRSVGCVLAANGFDRNRLQLVLSVDSKFIGEFTGLLLWLQAEIFALGGELHLSLGVIVDCACAHNKGTTQKDVLKCTHCDGNAVGDD